MPSLRQHRPLQAWLFLLAFILWLVFVVPAAHATGGVRVEWMKAGTVLSAETVTSSGSSAQSGAAPTFGGVGGTARITVTQGAVVVTPPASSPTATQTNGVRLQAGDPPFVFTGAAEGLKIAVIEATDAPAAISVTGISGGGGSGGTEYVEDAAAPANPTGGIVNCVRKDTLSTSEVSADGDIVTCKATNKGQIHVYADGSVSISGTLPAFASTPAVTISSTLPAFASTPAVTIGGTLPAFAATPTVNLGTIGTVATAANQTAVQATTGSTVPTVGVLMEGKSSADGNGYPIRVDNGGNVFLRDSVSVGVAVGTTALQVSGSDGTNARLLSLNSSGQVNVNNISGTVSLPTGAATAAKQPALGTAGAASTDVLTVQGIAAGTPLFVAGTLADDAAGASGTSPVPVGGIFNTTLPTYTSGDRTQFQFDSRGYLLTSACNNTICATASSSSADATGNSTGHIKVGTFGLVYNGTTWDRLRSIGASFGSATGVTAVEHAGASYVHLAANATTNATKSGAGILHAVCINTKGATGNTLTLYDNTTAATTVIAVVDTTAATGCMTYDLSFATGLSEIIATGTAADVTLVYR